MARAVGERPGDTTVRASDEQRLARERHAIEVERRRAQWRCHRGRYTEACVGRRGARRTRGGRHDPQARVVPGGGQPQAEVHVARHERRAGRGQPPGERPVVAADVGPARIAQRIDARHIARVGRNHPRYVLAHADTLVLGGAADIKVRDRGQVGERRSARVLRAQLLERGHIRAIPARALGIQKAAARSHSPAQRGAGVAAPRARRPAADPTTSRSRPARCLPRATRLAVSRAASTPRDGSRGAASPALTPRV